MKQHMPKNNIFFIKYDISYEPIGNKYLDRLPVNIREKMENAYHQIQSNPQYVIDEYDKLDKKYLNNPVFLHYLATAYLIMKNKEKGQEVVEKNYKRNKDYLFAKLNYAQICMESGKFKLIPSIFNNKFELKMLYPKRNVFHISEFLSFNYTLGMYFYKIKELKKAKIYYNMLKGIAPKENETLYLKRLLYPSLLNKLIRFK